MLVTGLDQQMVYTLRAAALGVALGLLYEILRAIRIKFHLGRWGTAALDLLFCLWGLIGFLLLMLRGTDGRLRLYLPLGLAAGWLVYRKTLSRWVLRALLWLLGLAEQGVKALWRGVLWAFSFPRGN